jgi:glycosyltransferase involved in cell wall biosynthesis
MPQPPCSGQRTARCPATNWNEADAFDSDERIMPLRVFFLIRSLSTGGAERQLVLLASGLQKRGIEVTVVTFYPGGAMAEDLAQTGVRVYDLEKRGRWDLIGFVTRLARVIRRARPSILYCFLPTANILGALLGRPLGVGRVVLGVRASGLDYSQYDRFLHMEARLAALLSRRAHAVVCNSEAGKQQCIQEGYRAEQLTVIPNGIDTDRFRFDPMGRKRLRSVWRVGEDEVLVGIVARHDPMKDHSTFLQAASHLVSSGVRVRFVCVGRGLGAYAEMLRSLATTLRLDRHLSWVEETTDLTPVYSSLDVLCSSSSMGEGFSNAIAEGMACERVCVVTDVGDSRRIVGDTGRVVAAQDPRSLAFAWREVMHMPLAERASLGAKARQRVREYFSVDHLVDRTQALLGLR